MPSTVSKETSPAGKPSKLTVKEEYVQSEEILLASADSSQLEYTARPARSPTTFATSS